MLSIFLKPRTYIIYLIQKFLAGHETDFLPIVPYADTLVVDVLTDMQDRFKKVCQSCHLSLSFSLVSRANSSDRNPCLIMHLAVITIIPLSASHGRVYMSLVLMWEIKRQDGR